MKRVFFIVMTVLFCWTGLAMALLPEERLSDPAAEERARGLSAQLRCLVCQNQSIDDSDAPFAKDMRVLIRKEITNGRTDDEIISFLRNRYGDYVLLNPPVTEATIALWVAPFAFLAMGVIGIFLVRRKKPSGNASNRGSG